MLRQRKTTQDKENELATLKRDIDKARHALSIMRRTHLIMNISPHAMRHEIISLTDEIDAIEKKINAMEKEKLDGEKKQDDDGRLYYEEGRRQFRNQQLYPVLSELDEAIMA